MKPPFLVLGLPRSRTAWLSRFLTYKDWTCGHDELRHARQLEDVKSWISQPCTGTVETAAAPFWRLALHLRPDLRIVTIRRNPEEAAESAVRCGLATDVDLAVSLFRRLDRKLGQIERRVPEVRSYRFEDLAKNDVCKDLFEHLLPYPHDAIRWQALSRVNVQINVPALVRYVQAHGPQIERLRAIAERKSLSLLQSQPVKERGGLTVQVEPLADVRRDAAELFRDHTASVGEHPENFQAKNFDLMHRLEDIGALQVVTARSNGKVFGYLATVIGPSLEREHSDTAVHTAFYASPDFPGVGLKLLRRASEALKDRGVSELVMRAGPRGEGPRTSSLFRRLGGEPYGDLYRLEL